MNRIRALLLAGFLSLACATVPALALAQPAGHHGRRGHVACVAKTKGKRHGKHAAKHTAKPARKCTRHAKHTAGVHSNGAGGQAGSGHPASSKHSQRSKGGPSSHQSSRVAPGHTKQSQATRETTVSSASSDAATIARVLDTTCENTELMPAAGDLEAVEQSTLCLVNQERARNGELPLLLNADLGQAAEGHSAEMVADDYFAHVSPSGETPLQRIEASGYIPNSQVGYTIGENIAWGTLYLATPKAIVAAWIASPEHLANILNAAYTETGLGLAPFAPASLAEGQPGAVYSQEFGVIEA